MVMASSLFAGFIKIVWASWWNIRYITGKIEIQNLISIHRLYQHLNCICTEKIRHASRHFQFFGWGWSEYDVISGTLAMAAIVCWQSKADCAESKSNQMCEIHLSYSTWPSRWVLCISKQWLRLKGCHVACDEWTSGEICSLQHHMWVTGSVMWAAVSYKSLKFGVQGASATN